MIVVTEGKYFTRPYAWAFQKNSPFLDIFNFYISEFIEKGQWNAIVNKYTARPQVCPDMSGMPIEFANCFTAFGCLVVGGILGIVVLGCEFIVKYGGLDHLVDIVRHDEYGQTTLDIDKARSPCPAYTI